jgi:hypothetical protein
MRPAVCGLSTTPTLRRTAEKNITASDIFFDSSRCEHKQSRASEVKSEPPVLMSYSDGKCADMITGNFGNDSSVHFTYVIVVMGLSRSKKYVI